MSNEEMLQQLTLNGFSGCGRFTKQQLDIQTPKPFIQRSSIYKMIAACIVFCFILNNAEAQTAIITDTINNKEVLIPAINKEVEKKQQAFFEQKDYTISGTVTDETGKPLRMVSVFTINNHYLSFTDEFGKFSIKLKYGEVKDFTNLSFSYDGRQAEVRTVHKADYPANINLQMQPLHGCCDHITMGVIEAKPCCDINISFPVDKLFEKPRKSSVKKKTKVQVKAVK